MKGTMRLRRSNLYAVLFLSAFLLSATPAEGCSCLPGITVQEQYEWASIIVIAQAVSVEKSDELPTATGGVRLTTMVVEKVFKGPIKVGEQMVFAQGTGADCVWFFSEKSIGQRYLFYLVQDSKYRGSWNASICGRSASLGLAADDLLYLENVERVRGKTRLSGTLSLYEAPIVQGQEGTRTTLAGKKVRVIGEKETYELVTNQDGVYEIYDLPAGRYKIEPEIPSGLRIDNFFASKVPNNKRPIGSVGSKRETFEVMVESGKHSYFDLTYGVGR